MSDEAGSATRGLGWRQGRAVSGDRPPPRDAPGPRPAGAWRQGRAAAVGGAGAAAGCAGTRAGRAGYADRPASSAPSPLHGYSRFSALPSRRSRDHGRSSREADQDQDRRGEAVRSRKRRRGCRLLSLTSRRPKGPARRRPEAGPVLQASPGAPRPVAGGPAAGTEGAPVPESAGLALRAPRARSFGSPAGSAKFRAVPPAPAAEKTEGRRLRPTAVVLRPRGEPGPRALPGLSLRSGGGASLFTSLGGRPEAAFIRSGVGGRPVIQHGRRDSPKTGPSFQRLTNFEASLSLASVPAARPRACRVLRSHPG